MAPTNFYVELIVKFRHQKFVWCSLHFDHLLLHKSYKKQQTIQTLPLLLSFNLYTMPKQKSKPVRNYRIVHTSQEDLDRLLSNDLVMEEEEEEEQEQEQEEETQHEEEEQEQEQEQEEEEKDHDIEFSSQAVSPSSSRKSKRASSERSDRATQSSQEIEEEESEEICSGSADQLTPSQRKRTEILAGNLLTSVDKENNSSTGTPNIGNEVQGLSREETCIAVKDTGRQKKRKAETYNAIKQKKQKIYHFEDQVFTKSDLECICSMVDDKFDIPKSSFFRYLKEIMEEVKTEGSYRIYRSAAELLLVAVQNEFTDLFFIARILTLVRRRKQTELGDFRLATLIKKTLGNNKSLSMTSSVDLKKILDEYRSTDYTYNLRDNPTSLKEKSQKFERITEFCKQSLKKEAKPKKTLAKESKIKKALRNEAKSKKTSRRKEPCSRNSEYLLDPEDEL